jgi:hypothetical protein
MAELSEVGSRGGDLFPGKPCSFSAVATPVRVKSLACIFGQIDVATAEIDWAASLAKGGGPRRSAALLVEISQDRIDAVGDMGRRIRGRFPKLSVPKPEDLARSSEGMLQPETFAATLKLAASALRCFGFRSSRW